MFFVLQFFDKVFKTVNEAKGSTSDNFISPSQLSPKFSDDFIIETGGADHKKILLVTTSKLSPKVLKFSVKFVTE